MWRAIKLSEIYRVARAVLFRETISKRQLEADYQALEKAHSRLLEAMDLLPQGVVILDEEFKYVSWNKAYTRMYPTTADLIVKGARLEDAVRAGLARGDYPEAEGREEEWLADRINKLKTPSPRHEQRLADGRWTIIEDRHMPDGSIVSLRVDISDIKRREESFRLLFKNNPLPMFVCDPATWRIRAANDAAIAHYGYSNEQILKMSFGDIHGAVDNSALKPLIGRVFSDLSGRTFQHVRKNGEIIDVELHANELDFEGEHAVLLACVDVTARLSLQHVTLHDSLTGLPNRKLFSDYIDKALEQKEAFAVMAVNLDRFKSVNDVYGFGVGDRLLVQAARRLKSCVGERGVVARLGGDEFGILLTGMSERINLDEVSAKLIGALEEPFKIAGEVLVIGASIGIAKGIFDANTSAELLRGADLAMTAAKTAGGSVYCYSNSEVCQAQRTKAELKVDLRRAIENNEFVAYYQPIIDFATGEVCCREALVRWEHPTRGLVSPSEFIPIAEETGMISAISTLVMSRACRDAALWPENIKVSVNVSAVELRDTALLERVRQSLSQANLPPSRLQVEVTETAIMSDVEFATSLLKTIRSMGVDIVMDDFGTGYSSLSFLRRAPIDKLKIDRSFVTDVESKSGRTVIASIISMARSLGIRTTVEGIETAAQRDLLKSFKCDEAQGYFFGKPVPMDGKSVASEETILAA